MDTRTDNTDKIKFVENSYPEFYTAVEIKEIIPDFNIAKGSRSLGILVSYGRVYIIYFTYDGELLWWKETEIKFRTRARLCISKKYLVTMKYAKKNCSKVINVFETAKY